MPENRSEAFEGKFSFKPFNQRPKLRPESIIKRPEKNKPVVETKQKESSWSKNQVDRFGKRFRDEGKLPPVKKVDTSGNSIYKAANMQIPKPPKQNITSRGVEELEGPEALGMAAPKPKGVFDRIKNFFIPPKAPKGVDPSGLMSPSIMSKYKIAVSRDMKKELTNTSEIKNAQTLLTKMGYTPYGVDGKIGNGTKRAVRKLQAQHGLEITGVLTSDVLSLLRSSSVQAFPDKPNSKAVPIAFDAKDLSLYSDVISQIESKGKYNIMGGAGNTYVGKYQLGKQALTDLNYGYSSAKIKALLADPDKQEELFKEYTDRNHKELTRVSGEYRNMSKEEQLGVLGYAHNQGATAAAEFLFTGVVGSDAFDTKGTEYTKAVIEAFGWTAEGEKFAEENKDILRDSFPELKQWTETSGKVGTSVTPVGTALIPPFLVSKAAKELEPYAKLVTSTPAKYLIKDVTGWAKGKVLDENSLTDEELSVYKSIFNDKGLGLVKKSDYGITNKTDPLQVRTGEDGSMLNLPANVSAYFSVGDTTLMKNDAGEVIVRDTYDYEFYTDYDANPDKNGKYPVVKTEDFEKNYTTAQGISATIRAMMSGKIGKLSGFHNIGFLLGSRGYKDSSKNEGSPIIINLGRPEDWT